MCQPLTYVSILNHNVHETRVSKKKQASPNNRLKNATRDDSEARRAPIISKSGRIPPSPLLGICICICINAFYTVADLASPTTPHHLGTRCVQALGSVVQILAGSSYLA